MEVAHHGLRPLRLVDGLLQVRTQPRAQLREHQALSLAIEERRAELGLELLDRGGERGLRDLARLSRAREASVLANREEVANLVELHVGSLSIHKPHALPAA